MKKIFIVLVVFLVVFGVSQPVNALTRDQQIVMLQLQILQLQLQIAQILEKLNTPTVIIEKPVEESIKEIATGGEVVKPIFTSMVKLSNGRQTLYPITNKPTYAYDVSVSFENADYANLTCDGSSPNWHIRLKNNQTETIYQNKGLSEKKNYGCKVELVKGEPTGEVLYLQIVFP